MSKHKAIGSFAAMHFDVMRQAAVMQAAAMEFIREAFEAEPEEFNVENPSWESLVTTLEKVENDPVRLGQLNARLAEQLLPIIEQALMQPQEDEDGSPD